jgi:pyruvate/2-oxoglutarate dehydrogenase complex dihydrolipoamide dehydrogenase (E3) component
MTQRFDAIIVGAGQAGPPLAVRLAQSGRTIALVERDLFGGTCVNTGCIPTKTLIASARVAHVARSAGAFGVAVGGAVTVDMRQVKARKDAVVQASRSGVEDWLRATRGVSVIRGHARFIAPRSLAVDGTTYEAERIFLNVGGRPGAPAIDGLASVPYLTSSSMMDVDFLPEHLVIIGGSYIGLEFAQMYRRFGARVTVVEMSPRVIPREDPEISASICSVLEHEGVTIHTDARCIAVRRDGVGVALEISRDGVPPVQGSHLLVAAGRRPNTDDLGLAAAGIETDAQGYIPVDDALMSNVPGVYVLGDANRRGAFTHTSYNDFEIVAANVLEGAGRRVSDRVPTYALFVDPPLGRVGMTEAEVRKRGRSALMATRPMTRVGRAYERSETAGMMKVLVDPETKRILGAAILGIEGDEVIHVFTLAMNAKLPYDAIQSAMPIHPTVAELLPTLLGDLKPLPPAGE